MGNECGRGSTRVRTSGSTTSPPKTTEGTFEIKVDWCGICGTDLHEYLEGPIFTPVAGSPHPLTGEVAPVQLGHEFAGHITEVGSG